MLGQERNYLTTNLQLWDVAVEVHPVKALEIENDTTVEHIIEVDHLDRASPPATTGELCFTEIGLILLTRCLGVRRRARGRASLKHGPALQ